VSRNDKRKVNDELFVDTKDFKDFTDFKDFMDLLSFDYNLPPELIAQTPAVPRDHSRLMVLDKTTQTIEHDSFYNLPNYLNKGDVLVFNNSKVFKARLFSSLETNNVETHSNASLPHIEIFLLKKITPDTQTKGEYWQVLAKPGKKLKPDITIHFAKNFSAVSLGHYDDQTFLIKFNVADKVFWKNLEKYGHIPIPPYIKDEPKNFKQYQTIHAKQLGSVAAPTAGLHFTPRLIKKIRAKGVKIEQVTLHVGLGTFLPVKVDDITKHQMHSELAIIDQKTANRINQAKAKGSRIIAVGTTSCRVLESAVKEGKLTAFNDYTKIFIYPPYKFKTVDALITNFHLPKSTLLILVSALIGQKFALKAYDFAIKAKYRFFSFGDSMLIK
jgi:S-adenosylmethionine:tRNA ribosyltransferase-isomerase